jgi:GH15 family glucan-1,4-alpha-glucosidase
LQSQAPTIDDYALIGDARSCALVSRNGSIDWLCLPHFSSPSLFGAILDPQRGGRFSIAPEIEHSAVRRYAGGSAVMETEFRTATGSARITDAMIIGRCSLNLAPLREIVRIVDGVEGSEPLRVVFDPRPDYAGIVPRLEARTGGLVCRWGSELLLLRCDREMRLGASGVQARFEIAAGDRLTFSLSYDRRDIGVLAPLGASATKRVEETCRRWDDWCAALTYRGRHAEAVRRSAVTLKLMTFAPSGAVVAAPTTSLPGNGSGPAAIGIIAFAGCATRP